MAKAKHNISLLQRVERMMEGTVDIDSHDEGVDYFYDQVHVHNIIFNLTFNEVGILLFKSLGYRPEEIVKIMEFRNIGRYYKTNYLLKLHYEKENKL